MYIERVRGDFWDTTVVTMWCRKEVVKISLQRVLKVVLVKLPRASKGEERKRKTTEDRRRIPWEV